jgi:hypothetical protein
MTPTVAELRAESADMVVTAMAEPCPERTAFAVSLSERLFDRCRSPFEALLIPALAIWAAVSGGTVRCQAHLRPFGRIGFLVEHPRFRQPLVIECDRTRRTVARDQALEAAGYAVCRLVIGEGKPGVIDALDAAFEAITAARLH